MSDTPRTNAAAWYGGYVRKKHPVVFATLSREIERDYLDAFIKARCAEREIEEAHRVLDELGVTRLQPSGLPYSIVGRLRVLRGSKP